MLFLPQIDKDEALDRYMKEIANSRPLSSEREVELAKRIKRGDEAARNELVEANLRFVVTIANEYKSEAVPLSDRISAGNIGLITAAERFDETKGFRFISYAVWWIRQAILQCIAEYSRVVRIPLNQIDLLQRIKRFNEEKHQAAGVWPSHQEIADEFNVSQYQVSCTLAVGQRTQSLDATFTPDDEGSLMEIVADPNQLPPDNSMLQFALAAEIEAALETLTEREATVVSLYFGLRGGSEHTLAEIGRLLRLTRERVRQIKVRALQRLKFKARSTRLRQYCTGAESDSLGPITPKLGLAGLANRPKPQPFRHRR